MGINNHNDISGLGEASFDDEFDPLDQNQKALVFQVKAQFQTATAKDIATGLKLPLEAVRAVLNSVAGRVLTEQLEIDQAAHVSSIRKKALLQFSELLDDDKLKPETRLKALMFALSSTMSVKEEKRIDSLIFETIISDTGQVEQRTLEATTDGNVNVKSGG